MHLCALNGPSYLIKLSNAQMVLNHFKWIFRVLLRNCFLKDVIVSKM